MKSNCIQQKFCILFFTLFLMVNFIACNSSSDSSDNSPPPNNDDPVYTETACTNTGGDSTENPDGTASRIISHMQGDPVYQNAPTRQTSNGDAVYMDYMVHEPNDTAQALLVLIAGGNMDANIDGDTNTGDVTSSGSNFLVRSAHLFADQDYRVITIDRPTDFGDWPGTDVWDYDAYRISVNHAVDLSRVINRVKDASDEDLPVVIVGTSRGAISAVNQHFLADGIALSSPVTGTGGGGTPVGSGDNLPANISTPTHVLWHAQDGCIVTTPAESIALLDEFPDVVGDELDGGFADTVYTSVCGAWGHHGFMGIESCAVSATVDWIASLTFPANRPTANVDLSRHSSQTPIDPDQVVDIDLSASATASPDGGGALTFSLPYTTTSLGGTTSISGSTVTYTPPAGLSGANDTFVYVVSEEDGGKSHNRVIVTIN